MGNSGCTRLDMLQSACELEPCLEGIRGLASYSTSSSDTWKLALKSGTKYETREIRTAFLKFWLTEGSIPRIQHAYREHKGDFTYGFDPEDLREDISGLNYELLVYKQIIRPLVDFSVCPHFVNFLGKGEGCTGKDLVGLLRQRLKAGGEEEEAGARFARNFEFLYSGEPGRPSITSPSSRGSPPGIIETLAAESKYNLLITESMAEEGNYTLDDFMDIFLERKLSALYLWQVLFQILAACYALSLTKTVHNDLHPRNVFVRFLKERQPTLYVYNDEWYKMNIVIFVRLYDFDRAFTESLGKNNYLRGYQAFNQTNEFVPNKDAVKICGNIHRLLGASRVTEREQLLQAISPPNHEFAREFLSQPESAGVAYLRHPRTEKNLSASDLAAHFYPVETMLRNVASLAGVVLPDRKARDAAGLLAAQKNIAYYACNRRMFGTSKGLLLTGGRVRRLYGVMLSNAIARARKHVARCEAKTKRLQQEIRAQQERIASLEKKAAGRAS